MLRDTEAWFLRRGIPHFIDDYRAREDVFTRALPALTLLVLFEVLGAANFTWPWWQNVIAVVGGFALLIVVWMAANRMRHRPALQRPDSLGPVELAFFVLVPAVLPLLFGGQYGSAAVTAAADLVLVLAIYLVTSYGLVSLTRWALGRTLRQVGAVTGLIARALPMLLLFTTLLFLTTEVWQVAASVSGVRFALTMLVFLLAGVLFLTARLPVELGRLSQDLDRDAVVSACRASPLADVIDTAGPELIDARAPELSRRQKGNVLLVLLFSQGVQVVLVTLVMGVVLFGFGLLAIRPTVDRVVAQRRRAVACGGPVRALWRAVRGHECAAPRRGVRRGLLRIHVHRVRDHRHHLPRAVLRRDRRRGPPVPRRAHGLPCAHAPGRGWDGASRPGARSMTAGHRCADARSHTRRGVSPSRRPDLRRR